MAVQKEQTNLRKLNEHCKKCGAVGGEYCRHSSGSKRNVSAKELAWFKMIDFSDMYNV